VRLERGDVAALAENVGDAGDVTVGDGLGEARIEGGEAFGGEAERGRIGDGGGRPGGCVDGLAATTAGSAGAAGAFSLQAARTAKDTAANSRRDPIMSGRLDISSPLMRRLSGRSAGADNKTDYTQTPRTQGQHSRKRESRQNVERRERGSTVMFGKTPASGMNPTPACLTR
jgi:hypothetical protein